MPHTSYTEDLELRLVKAQRQQETLKASAHAAVTHWLITNGERYSLRLHYFERERARRGEILTNTPDSGTYYRYGLMADERITVEECYEDGKLVYEVFWQHTATTTQTIRYVSQRPTLICQLDNTDGLPTLYRHYGYHREETLRMREIYVHWDDRLTTMKCEGNEYGHWIMDFHCLYTPKKELERIDMVTVFPEGHLTTVYRAPIAQNASAPDARRQALVDSIVAAIVKENITKTVCALMVGYVWPECFQVLLDPLFEEDRRAYLAQNPKHVELIWNSVEVSPNVVDDYIELTDSLDLWAEAERQFGSNDESVDFDDDRGRKLLADIAHDLHSVDWTGKLNITDDFVAFSLDYEGDSLQERLAASVPQEKLDLLRARGLW